MRITLLQTHVETNDVAANLANLGRLLAAQEEVGDLVVLPELYTSGYLLESPSAMNQAAALSSAESTLAELRALATEHHTTLLVGMPELSGTTVFNSALLIDRNGVRTTYRKLSQTLIDRTFFARGEQLVTFRHAGLRFGIVICFDLWFPEIVRAYAAAGIDVLLHLGNFGGPQSHALALARAIENGIHVVTCNRVGRETLDGKPATYCGGSRIVSPTGEILVAADGDSQMAISQEIPDTFRRTGTVIGVDLTTEIGHVRCRITSCDTAQ